MIFSDQEGGLHCDGPNGCGAEWPKAELTAALLHKCPKWWKFWQR